MATSQWEIRLVRFEDNVVLVQVLLEVLVLLLYEMVLYEFYELQKMYFLLKTKEKGLGSQMMRKCLQQAKRFDFTDCYLETMPNMMRAQKLYQKWGFIHFEHPIGNTNHCSYPVWIVKLLEDDT